MRHARIARYLGGPVIAHMKYYNNIPLPGHSVFSGCFVDNLLLSTA